MAYTEFDQDILRPFGGNRFAANAVKAILSADKRAFRAAGMIFDDMENRDSVGDIRRDLINENVIGSAQAMGLSCLYVTPSRQRYHNPVIFAEGAKMTISRMYGKKRLSRPSRFRDSLPIDGQLSLFGSTNEAGTVPESPARALVLAYRLDTIAGKPFVAEIEIQLLRNGSQDVIHRIDLMEKEQPVIIDAYRDDFFNELEVKPKDKAKEKSKNA